MNKILFQLTILVVCLFISFLFILVINSFILDIVYQKSGLCLGYLAHADLFFENKVDNFCILGLIPSLIAYILLTIATFVLSKKLLGGKLHG